jgi:starch-binding outer membrane protein, SusD/RagB family
MFILYDLFGPLNVKLSPATVSSNTIEPRLSDTEYVTAMEKDINEALPALPDRLNSNSTDWGRVSKGVAKMILMKLYMQQKEWVKAQTVGNELLKMGYTLLPNYKDVFMLPANNEIIYGTPGNPGILQYWYQLLMPSDAAVVLDVRVQVGWQGEGMPWEFYDKYTPGDERLLTIAKEYLSTKNEVKSRANGKLAAAIPMKYLNYKQNNEGFPQVIYRYADVLLAMAEIENEINGPTQKAIDLAQQVAGRSKTSVPAAAKSSKETFRNWLLDERGRELYFEFGIRRQDLIRHEKLITFAHKKGITRAADHHVLFPIPSDVIIESNGIITQNPGYQ